MTDHHLFWPQAIHELRNPLNVIQLVLDRLNDTSYPLEADKRDRYLQRAQTCTTQMEQLLAQLALYEQIKSGRLIPQLDHHVIKILAEDYQQSDLDPKNQLEIQNQCQEDSVWLGDRLLLGHILSPILQHSLMDSPVQMIWQQDAETLTIEVRSQGTPTQEASRWFEPFYCPSGQSLGTENGWGLGLAIAQAATQLCGGQISLNPLTLLGSCFWVRLPHPIG
jgi:K+-sensing histidine kinase KdpD